MLKQFDFDDFIDMYDELKFAPEDVWQKKYAAFNLAYQTNDECQRSRSHFIWLMNYLDCLSVEMKIEPEFLKMIQLEKPTLLQAESISTIIRHHLQY